MKPIRPTIKSVIDATLKTEMFKVSLVSDKEKEKALDLAEKLMYSLVMDSTSQFLGKLDKVCDPIHNKILNMLLNSNLPEDMKSYAQSMKQEKNLFNKIALKISSLKDKLDEKSNCCLEKMTEEQSSLMATRLETKSAALIVCFNSIKKLNNAIVIDKLDQNDYTVNLVLVLSELEKKIKSTQNLASLFNESVAYIQNHAMLIAENDNLTQLSDNAFITRVNEKTNNLTNIDNVIHMDNISHFSTISGESIQLNYSTNLLHLEEKQNIEQQARKKLKM